MRTNFSNPYCYFLRWTAEKAAINLTCLNDLTHLKSYHLAKIKCSAAQLFIHISQNNEHIRR